MAFLKFLYRAICYWLYFLWHVFKLLLITVIAIIVMSALGFIWPVPLLLILALPQSTRRLWNYAGRIKVW